VADLDDCERSGLGMRIGISQEPPQEKFLRALKSRLAKKESAKQQDDKNEPESGSLHRAEVKEKK
jgi:hypothetical protein